MTQPHTSAGRIPTEKAYRYYVDRWLDEFVAKRPNLSIKQDLKALLQMQETDLEPWAQRASRILSEVLGGVCVALPSRMVLSTLVKLEFVPLDTDKIVAIWVDNQGEVEHRVIENHWHYAPHQLVEMGNFATTHFRGLTLSQMQKKMMEGIGEGFMRSKYSSRNFKSLPEIGKGKLPVVNRTLSSKGFLSLLGCPNLKTSIA